MALTHHEAVRLKYLQRVRPNDPQIAQLQAMAGNTGQTAMPRGPYNDPGFTNNSTGINNIPNNGPNTQNNPSILNRTGQNSILGNGTNTGTGPGDPTVSNLNRTGFGSVNSAPVGDGTGNTNQAQVSPSSLARTGVGGVANSSPFAVGAATAAQPQAATFGPRENARLNFLLKNRPNDPQVAQLQKMKAANGGQVTGGQHTDVGDKGLGDTGKTVDDFLQGVFQNVDTNGVDLSGAPKVYTGADLASSRQSAYDSLYSTATQNLERNRLRDLEAAKQETADRGIPYDPSNPESAYGKAIGGVEDQYHKWDQEAQAAANNGADQRMATESQVNAAAGNQFSTNKLAEFNSKLTAASTASNALNVLMQKYKMTRDEAQAALDRAQKDRLAQLAADNNLAVANIRNKNSGSSTDTTSDVFL